MGILIACIWIPEPVEFIGQGSLRISLIEEHGCFACFGNLSLQAVSFIVQLYFRNGFVTSNLLFCPVRNLGTQGVIHKIHDSGLACTVVTANDIHAQLEYLIVDKLTGFNNYKSGDEQGRKFMRGTSLKYHIYIPLIQTWTSIQIFH
ncbi:hypothetical protein D9M71_689940 [compost metagenome]